MAASRIMSGVLAGVLAGGVLSWPGRAMGQVASTRAARLSKVHPAVLQRLTTTDRLKVWVFFTDKGAGGAEAGAVSGLANSYPARATRRRGLRRTDPGLFDARDLPVAPEYKAGVQGLGVDIAQESRWANAVSVRVCESQLESLNNLAWVREISPVRTGETVPALDASPVRTSYAARDFYGLASDQLTQIDLPSLHARGYTGRDVVIGILDTGFRRDHDAFNQPGHAVSVLAEYDFINHDGNAGIEPGDNPDQHSHGTLILGCIGAYFPGTLVGGAYDASFVLCKTEDVTSETPIEEDNYVAGLEFIELHGGDMATSSLGYIDWYTQADLNGATAVTTLAVNVATANGLVCCTAAGNAGHDDDPATSHLIAPADAPAVLTCGAAGSGGAIAGFSSDGPSADGRLKPEILARGVNTLTVWPGDTVQYAQASGTSLSTPLVAGAVACLIQAHPDWTVARLRQAIFDSAGDFVANGEPDPLFVRGYGMLDANLAAGVACDPDINQDGNADQGDVDSLLNVVAGGENPTGIDPDFNRDGNVDQGDVDSLINVAAGGGCP